MYHCSKVYLNQIILQAQIGMYTHWCSNILGTIGRVRASMHSQIIYSDTLFLLCQFFKVDAQNFFRSSRIKNAPLDFAYWLALVMLWWSHDLVMSLLFAKLNIIDILIIIP